MSHRLVAEVFDHAPPELTSLERLLLLAIAEAAQDHDRPGCRARECFPSMRVLCQRTGASATTVRSAWQRLALRGLEARVPVGVDRRGQAVYAYTGKATRYRLPDLVGHDPERRRPPSASGERDAATHDAADAIERRPPVVASGRGRRRPVVEKATAPRREGDDPSSPYLKEPQRTTPQPPATPSPTAAPTSSTDGGRDDPRWTDAVRAARATVEADLVEDVVALALADPATRSAGRLAVPAYADHLAAQVRARRTSAAQERMAELTRHDQPTCHHDTPGGASAHPRTGEPLCVMCRSESRQTAADRGVA